MGQIFLINISGPVDLWTSVHLCGSYLQLVEASEIHDLSNFTVNSHIFIDQFESIVSHVGFVALCCSTTGSFFLGFDYCVA